MPHTQGSRLTLALMLAASLATAAAAQPAPATPPRAAAPAAKDGPVVYTVAMLLCGPLSPAILEKLKPLHDLQAVEALYKANLIPFSWAQRDLNTYDMPPELAEQLAALPAKDVFLTQQGNAWIAGEILSRR